MATRREKKKEILEITRGTRGRKNRCVDIATGFAKRMLHAEYKGRRQKKRAYKTLWIQRLNAILRLNGLKYSTSIRALQQALPLFDRRDMCAMRASDLNTVIQSIKA